MDSMQCTKSSSPMIGDTMEWDKILEKIEHNKRRKINEKNLKIDGTIKGV